MRELYKLYKGDHWDLVGSNGAALRTAEQQKNRPNSVENTTFALIEGTAAEFSQDVELIDTPVEPGDDKAATSMSDMKKFLFYKNKIIHERPKLLRWFFLYGTLIWHVFWDPDWRGGRGPNRWEGDIRWKAMHPLMLVPDARCKEDINEGNRCHKVVWKTLEAVRDQYPDRAHIVQEETQDENDLLDTDQLDSDGFNLGDSLQEMVPVIETWYVGSPLIAGDGEQDQGTGLHVIWWAGEDQGVYLRHENYIYFEPGETPEFPFFVKQRYPRENSIWGFGDAYFLKNPQIVLNKTAEIILEGHMHSALGQTFYNENAISPKQKKIIQEKGTIPGMWFGVKDITGVKREYAQNVPSSLQNEVTRLQKVMEALIGRFDVTQGKNPSGVTAFRAIAELSARAQVRLRLAEQAITSAYEEAGQFTNRLIGQFYTEQRRYRIRGENDDISYNSFNMADMLKVYDHATGVTVPYNQVNPSTLSPDRHEVYCPEFDTMCKVTSVVPSDRVWHMEMAKELLTGGIIDIETFLDVMRTGRFPPVEKILQRMEEKRQQEQAMQQQEAMMKMGGNIQQPGGAGSVAEQQGQDQSQGPTQEEVMAFLQQLQQQRPDVFEQVMAMPEGQQEQAIMQLMGGGTSGQA